MYTEIAFARSCEWRRMDSATSLYTGANKEKTGDVADNSPVMSSAKPGVQSPKTIPNLEDLFVRFEAFNFDDDEHFQAGLSRISTLSDPNRRKDQSQDLLKVKAFYYSKHVEPFDFSTYIKWRQEQKRETSHISYKGTTHTPGNCSDQDSQSSSDKVPAAMSAPLQPAKATGETEASSSGPDPSSEDRPIQPTTNSQSNSDGSMETHAVKEGDQERNNLVVSDNDQELSFAEIAELVQSGQPIPGLNTVEVLPTNQDPTPARLHRAKKPWEG